MAVKTENRKAFLKFFEETMKPLGGIVPKDIEKWFDLFQEAKREFREYLGEKSKDIDIEVTSKSKSIDRNKSDFYTGMISRIIPNYYNSHYHLLNGLQVAPEDIGGVKFSKHILTYAKDTKSIKLPKYQITFLENMISEMMEQYAKLTTSEKVKFNCQISTEAKSFAFMGNDGVNTSSCWQTQKSNSYIEQQKYKWRVGLFPKSAICSIYPDSKTVPEARCILNFSKNNDIIYISNWYQKYNQDIKDGMAVEIVCEIAKHFFGENPASKLQNTTIYGKHTNKTGVGALFYLQGGYQGDYTLFKEKTQLKSTYAKNGSYIYMLANELEEYFPWINEYKDPEGLTF